MKRVMKHIAVLALAVTTMGAGTSQVQAGSDLRKVFVGAVTVGIIADRLHKKKTTRQRAASSHSSRSFERSRLRSNHRVIRSHRHRLSTHSRRGRHISRHALGH